MNTKQTTQTTKTRTWIDSFILNSMGDNNAIKALARLIQQEHTLVVANTVVDMRVFQERVLLLDTLLRNHIVVIEVWNTPDEMVGKPFFWSSHGITTPACNSLVAAVFGFEKAVEIIEIDELIKTYGIPKGEWKMGQWAPPQMLSEETAKALKIPVDTSDRSTVLEAAKRLDKLQLFNEYNVGYLKGLATQHCCDAILNIDGTFTRIEA